MPTKRVTAFSTPHSLMAASITSVSRGAAEAVAARLQFAPQLAEIVDLAVVGDDVAAVGRMHRLRAGLRQVDDRQPAMAEPDAGFRVAPAVGAVGAAMGEGVGHGARDSGLPGAAVNVEQAGDAAHQSRSF